MGFGLFYIPTLRRGSTAGDVYDTILKEACAGEDLGWDNFWVAEHHFDELGGLVPSPVVLAAAVAARTTRIRIGAAVAVLPMHDGLRLAEEYAMLDVLSGGRAELGIGRGFSRHEFRAVSISMESRQARFEEGLAVLLGAWTQKKFSFSGEYYHLHDVELFPRPLQQPHPPIWVAVSLNRQSFELAGRHGFNLMLNPYSRTLEEIQRGLAWYRDGLAQGGHDQSKSRIMVNHHLYCAPGEAAARDEPRDALLDYLHAIDRAFLKGDDSGHADLPAPTYDSMYPHRVMFGTPQTLEAKIRGWMGLGITDFCFMSQFGNLDPALAMASIRLFSQEVLPGFR